MKCILRQFLSYNWKQSDF